MCQKTYKATAKGADLELMGMMTELLRGKQIQDVLADSEAVILMLADGTQVTIRGVVLVEPSLNSVQRVRSCEHVADAGR